MLFGNYRADQWILGVIAGSKELGLYSVAVAWSEVLFFLPTTLVAVQRPDLVRASPEEARRRATVVLRGALILTLGCTVGMVLLAPFLCTTIFGSEFSGSVEMLRVLCLGSFGIATLKLLGNALTAQRRPLLETGAVAVAFVTVFALDFALIPDHGGLGASIASAASYTLGGLAAAVIFGRTLGASISDLIPRPSDVLVLGRSVMRAVQACKAGSRRVSAGGSWRGCTELSIVAADGVLLALSQPEEHRAERQQHPDLEAVPVRDEEGGDQRREQPHEHGSGERRRLVVPPALEPPRRAHARRPAS